MKSIISDKIEIRPGSINKLGMFAKEAIEPLEIVYIKGGHILTRTEMFSSSVINSYLPIADDLVIGTQNQEEENQIKLYNNHSCSPNCSVRGDIVFIATRKIAQGEELYIDYAFVDNEPYIFKCNCGSSNCRRIVTGFDWQLKELQKKYKTEYFSSYIQSKLSTGISYECTLGLSDQISDIRKAIFVRELGFALFDEFIDGDEKNFLHCCLYEKDNLLAYARIEVKESSARIGRVVVQKDKRNQGFGKQIMFWAETEILKRNLQLAEVHALDTAIGFYEKLGYKKDSDWFIEDGHNHIKMVKMLQVE